MRPSKNLTSCEHLAKRRLRNADNRMIVHRERDRRTRELTRVGVFAFLLVLARSFLPAWYEAYDFNSDQAIVGLMAKHLTELRTFPLFFYGQHYMLAVQ